MSTIVEDIKKVRNIEHVNHICTLKPARFKAFIRLVRDVVKLHGPHPLRFVNGRMAQPIGHSSFIVELDMSNILGQDHGKHNSDSPSPNGFTGNFIACEKHLRELSGVAGTGAVEVQDRNDVVLFSNGHTEGVLYKSSQIAPHFSHPILKDAVKLGEEIQNLEPKNLKSYLGKNRLVSLNCFSDQLEQIETHTNRPYTFLASSQPSLLGRRADSTFTSQYFLALAGKLELSLSLWRDVRGTWLKTFSRNSMVKGLTTWELLYEGKV